MGVEKLPIVEVADSKNRNGFRRIGIRSEECQRLRAHHRRRSSHVEDSLWRTFYSLTAGELCWPLYLWGDTGRGKTMAALCFVDVLGHCAWTDLDRLCEMLCRRETDWWEVFEEAECVIVDEIGGRDTVSSVDADAVKKIADLRERYGDRVAIYISNHPPEKIKELYGTRIFSRLCCGTIYQVTGPDRRMG